MKKMIISIMSVGILLAGCGQDNKSEGTKEEKKEKKVATETKKKVEKKKVEKEKKVAEKKEEQIVKKESTQNITSETQQKPLLTTETPNVNSTTTTQTESSNTEVKTNENGRKILGYTPEGYEIVDYASNGEPIVDMVEKPGSQAVGYSVGEAPPEQSYTRAPQGGNPDVQKPANNPYVDLPNQEWRVNAGGLSSGEIQTRNAILNGTYKGDDGEQVLEAINYYEQKYAPTP